MRPSLQQNGELKQRASVSGFNGDCRNKQEARSGTDCNGASTCTPSAISNCANAVDGADSKATATTVVLHDGTRLYWYHEAPQPLRYNPYIVGRYRAGLTYKQALRSILQYHNETGNIWSHLLPALLLTISIVLGWYDPWGDSRLSFLLEHALPIIACLLLSVAYHTCMACHNHYKLWLLLDVFGIFLVFLASERLIIKWSFCGRPAFQTFFIATYYVLATFAAGMAFFAKKNTWRAYPMLLLALLRYVVYALRLTATDSCSDATRHYITMELLAAGGGVINVMKVPERWVVPTVPMMHGVFDVWLNSHNIMHFAVLAAMTHLHLGMTADYWHHHDNATC